MFIKVIVGLELPPQRQDIEAAREGLLPPKIPLGSSVRASPVLQIHSTFIALLTGSCYEHRNRFQSQASGNVNFLYDTGKSQQYSVFLILPLVYVYVSGGLASDEEMCVCLACLVSRKGSVCHDSLPSSFCCIPKEEP